MFSIRPIALKAAKSSLNRGLAPSALRRTYASAKEIRNMVTITDAITKDHRELESYYNEVVNNPGKHDHQQRFGNQFTWELARHSIAEELVVYPALEKYLGLKGKELAEDDRAEHREIKEKLKVFQGMRSTEPDYIQRLEEIWDPLSEHMTGEEAEDLVNLEAALKDAREDSEDLARTFGRYKAFVPTRSHPAAGEHPPFETVMGLLTAPMDRIRDLFRKFPDRPVHLRNEDKGFEGFEETRPEHQRHL